MSSGRPATPVPRGERPARERLRPTTADLFRVGAWLGAIGFGGGLSVLAQIRAVAVERRRWLTAREFTNTATIAQMLPGGAAANALAYMGLRFRGPAGALAAYGGFVFPGFVATLALAALYVRYGASAPQAGALLGGLSAAVVGIVASLTIQLVRTGVARAWQMGVAAAALLFGLAGGASAGEVALLGIGAGLFVDLGMKRARLARLKRRRAPEVALPEGGERLPVPRGERDEIPLPAVAVGLGGAMLHATGLDAELLRVALVFFRTGLGAYGGGLAIVPHLKSTMEANGWLTARQFADAVAIGKITPGPVLLMGTFIGYVVGGLPAALLATASIFAAPLLLVVVLGTFLDRVRSRRPVRSALRGLTPAVAGLLAAATISLGTTLGGAVEVGIAAAVALTLQRFPANPALMLALGGAVRVALHAGAGL